MAGDYNPNQGPLLLERILGAKKELAVFVGLVIVAFGAYMVVGPLDLI